MGYYKVALKYIRCKDFNNPELIIFIDHISLITAPPLSRWLKASQVILEKGKGRSVENLHFM